MEVLVRPLSGPADAEERSREAILQKIFEAAIDTPRHPRTVVQITVQPMNNDKPVR